LITERAESPSGVGDLMRSHGTMVSRPQKPTGKKYRLLVKYTVSQKKLSQTVHVVYMLCLIIS